MIYILCIYILIIYIERERTNPNNRLMNPIKSQIGKISKQELQKLNKTLRSELNINQW